MTSRQPTEQLVPRFAPSADNTDLALQRSAAKRRRYSLSWLCAGLAVAIFLYLAIWIAPDVLARPSPSPSDLQSMTPENRATAEINLANAKNQVRTTLIQAIAGLTFLTTAFFAWRTVTVNRLGQLTDRFSKSVDCLGAARSAVRLGGVYTLQQLSADDRFMHPAANVLLAYMREAAGPPSSDKDPSSISNEVQESLTILTVKGLWGRAARVPIDLSYLSLVRVNMNAAVIPGANLAESNLSMAYLQETVLSKGDLRLCDLTGAHLEEATLTEAWLHRATLNEARLHNVKAQDAKFRGAKLRYAQLNSGTFIKADLTGADLTGADISGANFSEAVLTDVTTTGVKGYKSAKFENAENVPREW